MTALMLRPLCAALALVLLGQTGLAMAGKTGGFSKTIPNSREQSRNFYNAVYQSSEGVAMGWTGNLAQCAPGTTTSAYLNAGLARVNYFRAMAGLPASTTFLADYNQKAQQAALMMLANQALSHSPPNNWTCYTADGATAAGLSNLSAGSAGAESVTGYMNDAQVPELGHRRWIMHPSTQNMGLGAVEDAAQAKYRKTSVLWVLDNHLSDPRPAVRDGFVAWPPKGYVPYPLIFKDWSFAYPDADFSQATARLTLNGADLPVQVRTLPNGYGENGFAFRPVTPLAPSNTDQTFHVTVDKVLIDGKPQRFEYDVRGFDPAVKGAASVRPIISGPAQPALNEASAYAFTQVPGADGYQRRYTKLAAFTATEGAETGAAAFTVDADTDAYSVVAQDVFASGKAAFHLAETDTKQQTLTWNPTFYVQNTQAVLRFSSRLGWATEQQSAMIEASLDGGKTWKNLYQQNGTGGIGETSFVPRSISLKAYAGQTVQLRFAYAITKSGTYYPQSTAGYGWYIDDIRLTQTYKSGTPAITNLGKVAAFNFKPTTRGAHLLQVRATAFGGYPLEWGPGFVAKVP